MVVLDYVLETTQYNEELQQTVCGSGGEGTLHSVKRIFCNSLASRFKQQLKTDTYRQRNQT